MSTSAGAGVSVPIGSRLPLTIRIVAGAGAATLLIYALRSPVETLAALLSAGLFTLGLALGGGIFVATQAAAGATWWRPVAPVALLLLRALAVPVFVIGLVLFLGLDRLYPWARPEVVAASPLVAAKAVFLNRPFFLFRAVLVFLAWIGFAAALRRRLTEREGSLRRTSVLFLVVLAPTLSIGAWDWAMSLEPEWFSTMYGVTLFASYFVCGIAAVLVLGLLLEGSSILPRPLRPELLHDLGKLLFAFSCFWAYVWFCEFLLIWYANIPEEATHFLARQTGGWAYLFWLHPVLCFVLPFVALMSVSAKTRRGTLLQVASVVLVGHWLGACLMVYPSLGSIGGLSALAPLAVITVLAAMVLTARRLERMER